MKKESPIYIESVNFRAFSKNEISGECCDALTYDCRRDFVVDSDFDGMAIRIDFVNDHYFSTPHRGVRRNVSFTLIDTTSRTEVATQTSRVRIPSDTAYYSVYRIFPMSSVGFIQGHNYKLVIRDENSGLTLNEEAFHLFNQSELGHPAKWYTAETGGIRIQGDKDLFRSISSEEHDILEVRFDISRNFGYTSPMVMPELEIQLHYPDNNRVYNRFFEPCCFSYVANRYHVEMPFISNNLYNGIYYAELLCMEYPVAGIVFSIDGPKIEGIWSGEDLEPLEEYTAELADARFKSLLGTELTENVPLLASLEHLTGLKDVKKKLITYERMVSFNKMRLDRGLPVSASPLHAMFLGSPGTGKTTVAKLMGEMLHRAGLLSSGHVVVRERATLLGQNYNSEAEKTLEAIEEAQGGILMIDEAYQLYQPNDPKDPGKFVIETLLTTLADESKRDWMLVLAGYPEEMKRMFEMNSGFKSRIPDSNIYVFDDFSERELMEVAQKFLSRQRYSLTPDAYEALSERLHADCSHREKSFGNARHVINMIQTEILPAMAVRVITEGLSGEEALTVIQSTDIPHHGAVRIPTRPRIGFNAQAS